MNAADTAEGPMSLVSSILPAALQSRLPPLRSVRRTVRMLAVNTVTAGATSILGATKAQAIDDGQTPATEMRVAQQQQQPQITSHAVSETKTAVLDVEVVEDVDRSSDRRSSAMGVSIRKGRISAARSTRRTTLPEGGSVVEELQEEEAIEELSGEDNEDCTKDDTLRVGLSGVNWKYGSQGFQLLRQAREEALTSWRRRSYDRDESSCDEDDEADDASLERKLFLDGISYTLKALPQDLDDDEIRTLQASLPSALGPSTALTTPSHTLLRTRQPLSRRTGPNSKSLQPSRRSVLSPEKPRSILHRTVQILVSYFLVLIHVLFYYFLPMLQDLHKRLGESEGGGGLVGGGLEIASALGKRGADFTVSAMAQLGEGRVGQVLGEGFAWTVESVAGGLTEGVGDGLEMVVSKAARDKEREKVQKVAARRKRAGR